MYQVLRCSIKSKSSYVCALALCIVREIVLRSKDAFAPLIPESLPHVAELLEVCDDRIPLIAGDIVKLFEEINGESFEHLHQHR